MTLEFEGEIMFDIKSSLEKPELAPVARADVKYHQTTDRRRKLILPYLYHIRNLHSHYTHTERGRRIQTVICWRINTQI